jgi:hypothetical protein
MKSIVTLCCLMLLSGLTQPCNGQTIQAAINKINSNAPTLSVIIGTSVAVGYAATHTYAPDDTMFGTNSGGSPPSKLVTSGSANVNQFQTQYQRAILKTTPVDGDVQVMTWAQQFYNAMLAHNPGSIVDNQSGSGWSSASFLNQTLPSAGNTVGYVLGLNPAPDFVIFGTTINDWNTLSLSASQANYEVVALFETRV